MFGVNCQLEFIKNTYPIILVLTQMLFSGPKSTARPVAQPIASGKYEDYFSQWQNRYLADLPCSVFFRNFSKNWKVPRFRHFENPSRNTETWRRTTVLVVISEYSLFKCVVLVLFYSSHSNVERYASILRICVSVGAWCVPFSLDLQRSNFEAYHLWQNWLLPTFVTLCD